MAANAAGILGNLRIVVDADTSRAQATLRKLGGMAPLIGTTIGTGLGLAGVAALKLGDTYKNATDSIRIGTGATGDVLQGLENSFKTVAGRVPDDIGTVAQALADLNTRTGLTGEPLEKLTESMVDLSRLLGGDVSTNVANITRLYGDWSVATEDYVETNDKLLRVSQATGASIEEISDMVVQFGAPMRALGFTLEEGIALFGKWEKEGVNSTTIMAGLKLAVANFGEQGIKADEGLADLIERLKSADEATGFLMAKQIVGARAANDFYRAVVEGRFDLQEYVDVANDGADTIQGLADETRDAGDIIKETMNRIAVAVGDLASPFAGIAESMGNAIFLLPAMAGAVGNAIGRLWQKVAATKAGHAAAAVAGKLAGAVYTAAAFVVGKFMQAAAALWAMMGGGRIVALAIAAGTKAGAAYGGAVALASKAAALGGAIWSAAGTVAGGIMGSAIVAAVLPIASLALTAVAVKMGVDLANNIGQWQAEVQKGADAAVNQGASEAIGNLENLTKHMQEVQGLGRVLGDTFGGEQQASGLLNLARAISLGTDMTAEEIQRAGVALEAAAHEAGARGNEAVRQQILMVRSQIQRQAPVLASAMQTAYDPLSSITVPAPDIAAPIQAEFKLATAAVAAGFGSVKQALANPPKMISKDDRLTNMAARMKKVMANIKKATEVGDPMAQRYWEKARAKQQTQIERLQGKTTSSLGQIKRAYATTGANVEGKWTSIRVKTEQESRRAANTALAEIQSIDDGMDALDGYASGSNYMTEIASGIDAGIPAVSAAANRAAAAVAGPTKSESPPKMGPLKDIDKWGGKLIETWLRPIEGKVSRVGAVGARLASALAPQPTMGRLALAGAGGGARGSETHIHIGTLIADDRGLDELERRMSRRQGIRSRGPMRYQQK